MTALLARRGSWQFTSESVSEGHPDKVADQISDAVLDLCLARDPKARVACETMVSQNLVTVGGEYRFQDGSSLDEGALDTLVRKVVRDIGYEEENFHWQELELRNQLAPQSSEIAGGVDRRKDKELGAGDQGIMFGYASDETESLMPAPIHYAHEVLRRLSAFWHTPEGSALGPDAKSQVTLHYDGAKPIAVDRLVVSVQHRCPVAEVRELISPIARSVFAEASLDLPTTPEAEWFFVNPSGSFTQGGPAVDAGLTGRKIIVDTYGGAAPHGGGAFSGKDASKVDRSAAYATRYLAKNVVAAGLASACLIQVSYAIGQAEPCSFYLNLLGDVQCDEERLQSQLQEVFSLKPGDIAQQLQLHLPNYQETAKYGHFGRTYNDETKAFSWEQEDLKATLKGLVSGGVSSAIPLRRSA